MKSLKSLWKSIDKVTRKYTPEILTGLGVASMVTGAGLMIPATIKTVRTLDSMPEDAPAKEKVKAVAPNYIWPAMTVVSGALCVGGGCAKGHRRTAVATTAATMFRTALEDTRSAIKEEFGEAKLTKVNNRVAKKQLERDPVSDKSVLVIGNGNMLCYDSVTGRYFRTDIDKLKAAINTCNANLITDMYVSLNDFHYEIGLSSTELGDTLGWNIDDGLIDITFAYQAAENGEPCLALEYLTSPKYDYSKLG